MMIVTIKVILLMMTVTMKTTRPVRIISPYLCSFATVSFN